MKQFAININQNIENGVQQGKNCYKVRLKITGKNAGKSSGASIILQAKIILNKVYLLSIYDNADKDTITEQEIDKLLQQINR